MHILTFRPVYLQGDRTAHHQLGELLFIGLGCVFRVYTFSFSEDRHPVADLHNLVQLVGDNDNGASLLFHSAQNGKKLLGLLGREHCCRLV